MDRKALAVVADDDRLHGGRIGAPTKALGDAVAFEHLALALRRAAAVAAHRRDDDRHRPQAPKVIADRLDDDGDVCDAAAPTLMATVWPA